MRVSNEDAKEIIAELNSQYGTYPIDVAFSDIPESHPLQGLAIEVDYNPCLAILRNNPHKDTVFHEFYHCMAEQKGLPNTDCMADAFAAQFQIKTENVAVIAGVLGGLAGTVIGWRYAKEIGHIWITITLGLTAGGISYGIARYALK